MFDSKLKLRIRPVKTFLDSSIRVATLSPLSLSLSLSRSGILIAKSNKGKKKSEEIRDRSRMGFGFVLGLFGGVLLAHAAYSTIQCKLDISKLGFSPFSL